MVDRYQRYVESSSPLTWRVEENGSVIATSFSSCKANNFFFSSMQTPFSLAIPPRCVLFSCLLYDTTSRSIREAFRAVRTIKFGTSSRGALKRIVRAVHSSLTPQMSRRIRREEGRRSERSRARSPSRRDGESSVQRLRRRRMNLESVLPLNLL